MVNRQNYLLVKQHLTYLDEVRQISQASLDRYWFYLRHLLFWADDNFLSKSTIIKPAFPKYLSSLPGRRGEPNLSLTTQKKIINTSKRFYTWAKDKDPIKFRPLPKSWIEALHPPRGIIQNNQLTYVSLEDIIILASITIDDDNLALQRDQAAAAMLYLSGMRATAFTTMPIQAVDLKNKCIKQWPELGIKTKNGKRATTYLLPIPELLDVVYAWDARIRKVLNPSAPWYTPVKSNWGKQTISTDKPGKNRSQSLAKRLRILFDAACLEYKSPHKFRRGHTLYGLTHSRDMADYKAVSKNIMHNNIKTTDEFYATFNHEEVGVRIFNLSGLPENRVYDLQNQDIQNMTNGQLSRLFSELANHYAEN